jgi:hypothetical protein
VQISAQVVGKRHEKEGEESAMGRHRRWGEMWPHVKSEPSRVYTVTSGSPGNVTVQHLSPDSPVISSPSYLMVARRKSQVSS